MFSGDFCVKARNNKNNKYQALVPETTRIQKMRARVVHITVGVLGTTYRLQRLSKAEQRPVNCFAEIRKQHEEGAVYLSSVGFKQIAGKHRHNYSAVKICW